MEPTQSEKDQRNRVMAGVLRAIEANQTIRLPDFDPKIDRASDEFAMLTVGLEPNEFGGRLGDFRYQFEGEEDLLHLMVVRQDLSGLEPNEFGGRLGDFRYQFEGEEDLLHLMVVRQDLSGLEPSEARSVAAFLLEGVPPALVWYRPGTKSHHFYLGHDDLLGSLILDSA